jgi:hypothetical protein
MDFKETVYENVDGFHLSEYRDLMRALMNTVTNL